MKKRVKILVKESLSELKILQSKQRNIKSEKRVLCLIHLKKKTFKTQEDLAKNLLINIRTLSGWIKKYREKGLEGILLKPNRKKPSKIISAEIHEGLSKRVNSSTNPFLGYWDAEEWVFSEYGVKVKYHWLRKYLIKHFKTKLKTPRKSHYKKDEKQVDSFLKSFLKS